MAITKPLLPNAEDFARMEAELFGRLERSHTRQVRRHRLVAAASIVLLAGGGVAAVQVASTPAVSHEAYCYATADANARTVEASRPTVVGSNLTAAQVLADRVTQATSDCLLVWNAGIFSDSKVITVPQLQACVRNDQVIAVFPKATADSATDFCDNLGMSAP
jgi:hypothetical protein